MTLERSFKVMAMSMMVGMMSRAWSLAAASFERTS